uniref:Uncharacterized protein n=1 Tax=Amphora coffeiformis TaxID=265554 RepID=A0A7S3LEZ2_9STRA|mmetsp:Transcript_13981/g.26792  ORF Transcript_13981/g.26792 Transcript_13981/m.26792 type:complete len:120 (-) Transcript_13981:72-431(-)
MHQSPSLATSDQTETVRVRQAQWMYLGPIVAAPLAHICVTLYRNAKTPRQKQLLLGVGIIGSTVASIGMRLYLMNHAGYPGSHHSDVVNRERVVTRSEKESLDNPSLPEKAKEILRGFG